MTSRDQGLARGHGGTPHPDPGPALPAGTRLHADPGARWRDQGRLLIGGSPLRFLRLTEAGARAVKGWLAGEPPPAVGSASALARRLVDNGMVHPEPPPTPEPPALTVIIPVKDDQAGLETTLAGLGSLPVVVIDDGSEIPIQLPPDRAQDPPVALIRRPQPGGPGVARSEGLGVATSPVVAFVDAGVEVAEDQLRTLARWFLDPTLMGVAPRVAASPGDDLISRYEADRSPLDLGGSPSAVGHGRLISYLPTACLLARRSMVEEVGGFDPELRFGEDVDLVWRLLERGHVRYDPSVVVHHPPRLTLAALARQRYGYGLAAAPLAARHGSALAPVRLSPWTLALWALVVAGHPGLAMGVAAYTAWALDRKLAPVLPDHEVESVQLAARGHLWGGRSIAEAGVRIWWPFTVLAAVVGWRLPVRLIVAGAWVPVLAGGGGSLAERLARLLVRMVDDGAFGAGAWVGALRHRSGRCLAPQLLNWPGDDQSV